MRAILIRKRLAAFLLCLAVLLSGAPCIAQGAAAADDDPCIVVSLGDSYASGEGNEDFYGQEIKDIRQRRENRQAWEDWLAHRSTLAWSGQLRLNDPATGRSVSMTRGKNWFFAAASGAETENIVRTRYNPDPTKQIHPGEQKKVYDRDGVSGTYYLPGQLNIFYDGTLGKYSREDVDYVTVSIGGNDVGFVEVLKLAAFRGIFSSELYDNIDAKLKHFYDPGSTHDDILDAYLRIHAAAPNATIIVVGYPPLLSKAGNIGMPLFNTWECDYINQAVGALNDRLRLLVLECQTLYGLDIEFCSVETAFEGHGAYSLPTRQFIYPIMFFKRAQDLTDHIDMEKKDFISSYSMHPNEKGLKAYTECVQETINHHENKSRDVPMWVDAYYRFIRDRLYPEASPGQYLNDEPHRFALFDMDMNGVPELLIYNGDGSHAGAACIVYTYVTRIREIGQISCGWNEGSSDLAYTDNDNYPGLFHSDASTGLYWTVYLGLQDGKITSETVDEYDEDKGATVKRTKDEDLYLLFKSGRFAPLEMYTYDALMAMDWAAYVETALHRSIPDKRETEPTGDLLAAIDRSGVCRYISVPYSRMEALMGALKTVEVEYEIGMLYSFCFANTELAFSFDANLWEAEEETEYSGSIPAAIAKRYLKGTELCNGICIPRLSLTGFRGTVNAKDIGAEFFKDEEYEDLWLAFVTRNGLQYEFICDDRYGNISDDKPCWITVSTYDAGVVDDLWFCIARSNIEFYLDETYDVVRSDAGTLETVGPGGDFMIYRYKFSGKPEFSFSFDSTLSNAYADGYDFFFDDYPGYIAERYVQPTDRCTSVYVSRLSAIGFADSLNASDLDAEVRLFGNAEDVWCAVVTSGELRYCFACTKDGTINGSSWLLIDRH